MKEKDLRDHAICSMCGQKIGASGLPMFWTVEINQFALDLTAIQRQTGLGLMLGGALAMNLGPDEDLAKRMGEAAKLTVCAACVTEETCVAALAESVQNES